MHKTRRTTVFAALALPLAASSALAGITYLSGTARYRHMIENGGTTFNSSDSSIPSESNLNSVGYTLNSNQVFGGDGASSLGKARIGFIANATTASIALKTGTGITQSDPGAAPSHAFSETRISIEDATALRWDVTAPGFGPPSTRYASINVAGTVGAGGFARCFVNLAFYKNSISGANSLGSIVMDTGTISTAGAFNQTLVSSQPLTNSTLPTGTDIIMIGTILFNADNHGGPTEISLLDSAIGYTNTGRFSSYVGGSSGEWLNPASWQSEEGSVANPPNQQGERAYLPNDNGVPRTIQFSSPVTVGVLENNGSALTTIQGQSAALPLNLSNLAGYSSMVWNRAGTGDAGLNIAAPLNINGDAECVFLNDSTNPIRLQGGLTTFGLNPVIRKEGSGPLVIAGPINHPDLGVKPTYFIDEGIATIRADLGGTVGSSQSFTGGVFVGVTSPLAATAIFTTPQRVDEITVNDRGQIVFDTSTMRVASAMRTLTMDTSSAALTQVDITDDGLAFRPLAGDPFGTIMGLVRSGYGIAGDWNGDGIVSSIAAATPGTGVGYSRVSDLGGSPTTFMGQEIDANDVVIRYTLLGDSNLNEKVDIADFSRLAANFNTPGGWARGDNNYDLMVNISDFSLLAANFNRSLPPWRQAVPEPAALSVMMLSAIVGRRRCHRTQT